MPRKLIFVSCGQRTEDEIALGREVAEIIAAHDMDSFFAQDVHSASDLNTQVFGAIQACDGFLGILQQRGEVRYPGFPAVQRSSVWIQQEIAMFCYRTFLEPLRRQAARWAEDSVPMLRAADPAIPEALNDRAADTTSVR